MPSDGAIGAGGDQFTCEADRKIANSISGRDQDMPRFGSSGPSVAPSAPIDPEPKKKATRAPRKKAEPQPRSDVPGNPAQRQAKKPTQEPSPVVDAEWDELAIAWDEDTEKHVYRGSELHGCLTSLVAHIVKHDERAPMPEVLQKGLAEGHANEPIILRMLCEEYGYRKATYPELMTLREQGTIAGYNPAMEQCQARANIGSSAQLRVHLDAIVTHSIESAESGHFYVVEAKALGDSLWKEWKRHGIEGLQKGNYAWQVSGHMLATGLPELFVVGHKNAEGVVFEIDTKVFTEPPIAFGKLKAKVLQAEKYVKAEELPLCEDGRWPCAFFRLEECLGKPEEELQQVDEPELAILCARYWAASQDESNAKRVKKDLKPLIEKAGAKYAEKVELADEVGNRFRFRWVTRPYAEKILPGGMAMFPEVKLIGDEMEREPDAAEG